MNQDNYVSNCCGAGLIDFNEDTLDAICMDCKEHCSAELSEDYIEELKEQASQPCVDNKDVIELADREIKEWKEFRLLAKGKPRGETKESITAEIEELKERIESLQIKLLKL